MPTHSVLHEQTAVLPDAVVSDEPADVALVHVDVVNAVAGEESEELVLLVVLRSPPLAERIDDGVLRRDGTLHDPVDLLVQIIVEARDVERKRPDARAIEEIAA